MKYKVGQLVVNKKLGLGKILSIRGQAVTTYFKDQSDNPRTINVGVVPMAIHSEQSDPMLDEVDENGKVKRKKKVVMGAPVAKERPGTTSKKMKSK